MFRVREENNGTIKYSGRSKGVVVDNRDPLKRGRVRVDHPQLGDTVWIEYAGAPHAFDPPSIGDIVYLEAESGYFTHPIASGKRPKGDTGEEIPEVFKREVPTNRGWFTPGGHTIEMDDGVHEAPQEAPNDTSFTTENKGIRITSSGNNKVHIVEDEDAGNLFILIEDNGGNLIKMDYQNNELTINSIGKTQFDTAEDRTDTVGGNLEVTVTGNVSITGQQADFVGSSGTNVGSAGSPTQVQGSVVNLAGGGPGVSRLGDRAFGIGNLGAPVSSTIVQASSKTFAG